MSTFEPLLRRICRESADLAQSDRDEDLLGSFVNTRNEAAFEELLRRYGPMVMGVARRTMVDHAAAEDVFQATFLALVGRASSIRRREAVGTWLARVAFQTAKRARQERLRARLREEKHALRESTAPAAPDDLGPLLDEELNRLPEKYRQALVLCCVLEKPLAEAGLELGISAPAVCKRIQRGQEMLRRRLDSRGVAVTASTMSAVLAASAAGRADVASSIPAMIRNAAAMLGGSADLVPVRIVDLARAESAGAGRTLRGAMLAFGAAIAFGAVAFAALIPDRKPTTAAVPNVPAANAIGSREIAVLEGVVRDASNRPVPGASVSALAKDYARGEAGGTDRVLGSARADAEGKYRIPIPEFTAPIAEARRIKLLTSDAKGGSLGTTEVAIPPGQSLVRMDPVVASSRTVRGRVLDRLGLPVPSARVGVTRIGIASADAVAGKGAARPLGWPVDTTTNAAGWFEFPGIDENAEVKVSVEPRNHSFATAVIPPRSTEPVAISVGPLRRLIGRVLARDSGAEVSRARIIVTGPPRPEGMVGRSIWADERGRFDVSLPEGNRFAVRAFAPDGLPLLSVSQTVTYGPKDSGKSLDLELPPGKTVVGEVRHPDGSPISGAIVQYHGREEETAGLSSGGMSFWTSGADGRFSAVLPPGHGSLLVYGPSLEFLPEMGDRGELRRGEADGSRIYAHAIVPVLVDARTAVAPIRIELKPSTGIDLRIEMPDGSPLESGFLMCRHLPWPFDFRTTVPVPVRKGVVRLPGCTPGRRYSVLAYDDGMRAGAIEDVICTADAPARQTIRLKPLGRVTARIVRGDGKPAAGVPYALTMQLPFDGPANSSARSEPAESMAGLYIGGQFRGTGEAVGSNGRIDLPGLIQGVQYRFGATKGREWNWIEFEVSSEKPFLLPSVVLE